MNQSFFLYLKNFYDLKLVGSEVMQFTSFKFYNCIFEQ